MIRPSLLSVALLCLAGCAPTDDGADSPSDLGAPRRAADLGPDDDADLDAGARAPDGAANACEPLAAHLDELPPMPYPEDCAALAGDERFLCGEYWLWIALGVDFDGRAAIYDRLTDLIDSVDPAASPVDLARMHAIRGQLALALALENGDGTHLADIAPDFERAAALDPANAIIPTWKDSLDIALAWRLGQHDQLPAIIERTWRNVGSCRTGNILSISGTTIGLPLATGIPQATIERLDAWTCEAGDFCEANTWRAPYAQPGLGYHFAEAYARVGRRDDARRYLERALAAPGAEHWPYRPMVQDTLDHLDEVVAEFEALGDEGDAFDRMYANQDFGCLFCHAADPPAERVRQARLAVAPPPPAEDAGGAPPDVGPSTDAGVAPPADLGVEPRMDAGPEPSGACVGAADTAALAAAAGLDEVMGTCALECFGQPASCGAGCVGDAIGVSDGCAACFGDILDCTLRRCALVCLDATSAPCVDCQAQHCLPDFTQCSGLERP